MTDPSPSRRINTAIALSSAHVHPYQWGDTIIADDTDIPMMVTGFEYGPGFILVRATHWLDGKEEAVWIPLWRTKLKAG